jgi:hypothetical protein
VTPLNHYNNNNDNNNNNNNNNDGVAWSGYITRMGEIRNTRKISVGIPKGKRSRRRGRIKMGENTEMVLRKCGYGRIWSRITSSG